MRFSFDTHLLSTSFYDIHTVGVFEKHNIVHNFYNFSKWYVKSQIKIPFLAAFWVKKNDTKKLYTNKKHNYGQSNTNFYFRFYEKKK